MLVISQASSLVEIEEVRQLFAEYESTLGLDLCFQGFKDELASLPGAYGPPSGSLLLARVDRDAAGCVGLRKLEDEICEMKRLYVKRDFRRFGLGRTLVNTLIENACAAGYRYMRLDTHPERMGSAVRLYETLGFRPIKPYYNNPHEGVLFMELEL